MPEEENETKDKQAIQDATGKMPQPFKFIASFLFITIPNTDKWVQTIIVLLFACLIIVFSLASLKGIAGIDFFSFLNPVTPVKKPYYSTISGDLVMKGNKNWSPKNSNIDFTSAGTLYTRKEFMGMGYFRFLWIIKFPNNELETGEIDLSVSQRSKTDEDIIIAASLKKYSSLYDRTNPYRWVHLIIDSTNTEDQILISFAN